MGILEDEYINKKKETSGTKHIVHIFLNVSKCNIVRFKIGFSNHLYNIQYSKVILLKIKSLQPALDLF